MAPHEPQGALPADTAAPKKAVLICLAGISGLICSLAAPSLHPHPTRRVSLEGSAGILGVLRATSEHREGMLGRYDAYHLPLFPCQKGRRQSQPTTPNRCLKSGHFHPPGQTCVCTSMLPPLRGTEAAPTWLTLLKLERQAKARTPDGQSLYTDGQSLYFCLHTMYQK